jgi:glycosyltransferase involved in cell wall biosynthesis
MKILLLGDYSSLHLTLKKSLNLLGHKTFLVSNGDGFKKIGGYDLLIPNSKNILVLYFQRILFLFFSLKKLKNYDIVQLINPNIFGGLKFGFNQYILKYTYKNNNKLFLAACGTDYYVYKSRLEFRYNPYDTHVKLDLNNFNPYTKKSYINNNDLVVNLVNKIIPSMYSYYLPYTWSNKLAESVPLPIGLDKINLISQVFQNGKISIFHGLNRPGFKGTYYIIEAMEKIQKKYPDKVEIIIDGKIPIDKYLKLMDKVNIIVDQCLSYDYGMNALYGMAKGKVVLSGNEIESQNHFKRSNIPVINILPSVEDIFNKLEFLILNPNKIIEIGQNSRLFVEDFHDSIKIAKEYLKIWSS